ncbi:AT-rich interactive domain-containing protein 4B-like isoform X2 [Adelges cooleyi]|uniref:AT-rich interactive domain-containing protein 4B-like isoform X2 n=1 Tax=Adelges cooleyi TaxID=133065 RepID=UPI0021800382|nr:AT-rich interactive domain-containing protein 4B-like isoform X2 [Adelges cooleyi]
MVNLDEPPFLAVGTEVSAKYKGAFCEAKIRKISKSVKCKIQYSNGQVSFVADDAVKGQLKIGANVEVKCNEKKELLEGIIQKIQDHSQYTVVFDDGDITCLKRSALCLKSGKHFAASATLDQLPLTHPEHITSPTRNTIVYGRRSRKHKKSVGESGEEEILEMEEKDIGKVVCIESNDKKKVRDNWFPGLVVAPTAQSAVKTNVLEDYLVRSFKDGKYYTVPKKEITEFTKEIAAKVENPTLKTAVEKAILYLDKDELPPHWDRDLLFGLEKNCVTTDSEGAYDSDNSDEESIEEKDHFVAQLFKFMDDRGTPLNQAPMINDKDVDMYKLFKVVNNLGGFNKVGKCKQWKTVAQKVGHEQSVFSVKQYYQQYLHSFEDFYRKLGCTMLSHPRGVRSRSRFSRSIIRDVDKALPGTSTSSSSDKNRQTTAAIKLEPKEKKEKVETLIKEADIAKESATPKKPSKALKVEDKVASTLKSSDEHVTKKVDKKRDRPETIGKETEPIVKEPSVPKKPLKPVRVEEKVAATLKNNDEIPPKIDRKKEKSEIVLKEMEMATESVTKKPSKTKIEETITCPGNSARNKSTVKSESVLTESKDAPKDSKVKKEFKEATVKKEEEKTIEESNVIKNETKPADKADEKKKYSRNLFGKSMRRRIKKEKVEKTKPIETGLSGIRKMRSIKEQIKTFVKVITPSFKKPKRGASANQIEVPAKPKIEEELPKLTRSKSKDELPTRARKVSVSPMSSYVPCGSTVEVANKIKKVDEGSEKKKSIRKKKEDKDDKPVLNDSLMNSDVEYCDKDTIVSVGDNLVVYYGDKHATTYDAKVLNVCDIEGVKKYYVHYKGWNSRYDEWIDLTRIALKSKAPEPEPDVDNDGDDSSKSEQKNMDMKKMPPVSMTSRTRRSLTPCMSYAGGRKKSPFGSSRPTRTCTMVDQPLSSIGKYTIRDNSDSESEYSGNLGLAKQYNKRNHQSLKISKAERDDGSPTKTGDSPESDGQKKSLYPKTYPSKEALLQRSGPKKPKICGFRSHGADNKPSDGSKISGGEKATPKKQQPLPTLPPAAECGTPSSKTLTKNKDDEDVDGIGGDVDEDDDEDDDNCIMKNEAKSAVIHYPSPREKSERNADRRQPSTTPELPSAAALVRLTAAERKPIESSHVKKLPKLTKSSSSSVAYYHSSSSSSSLSLSSTSSSSEDEQIQLKTRMADDKKPPPLLKKRGEEPKPSVTGTDFDLNEIRSEMKGLTTGHVPPQPPTLSSNDGNVAVVADGSSPDVEPPRLKAEVRSRRGSTETTEDIYEFKEPEPCDLQALPSAIDEKRDRRLVKHSEPPKLYSFDKPVEPSTPMAAAADDPGALDVFRSVIHSGLPTDSVDPKDGHDKTEPPSDHRKTVTSLPVVDWPAAVTVVTVPAPMFASRPVVRPDEVLDLCTKPILSVPASEAAFVAGISIVDSDEDTVDDEEDEDEEDDDDAKLVIAENDKTENDYPMEMVDDDEDVDREHAMWPSEGHPAEDGCARDASPPPVGDADEDSKGSDTVERHHSRTPKQDVDDESTVSCNENDDQQNVADTVHQSAFQVYASAADHQSGKTPVYQPFMDNNDSTRSGYDFELSPTSSTTESAKETMFKLSSGDVVDFKDPAISAAAADQQRNLTGNDPETRKGVSELQCREEIVDEETLNNAIVSNYGRNVDYDIHKPSTSKGFFNAIHHQPQQQPVLEHHFYKSKSPSKIKADGSSGLYEPGSSKGNVPFDSGADKKVVYEDKSVTSKDCGSSSSLYDNCVPSTSKCNFYDTSMPSTSKGFYNPEADVNNVLFCEETIPGSPTGAADDQYDQEDRKKSINQYYEEREAASAMFAMNLAFRNSAIASNDSEPHDYDMLHGDGNIDQRHLRFLAEVSSRDESSFFTKPVIPEPQPTSAPVEQVTKVEKPQAKRKISSHEHTTGKRNKAQIAAAPEPESERYDHSKIPIPTKDGKPLVTFTPEMDSAQRQVVILAKINELRKDYNMVKARIVVVDRRRKKIRKRKRELAKSNAAVNPNKQSPAVATK